MSSRLNNTGRDGSLSPGRLFGDGLPTDTTSAASGTHAQQSPHYGTGCHGTVPTQYAMVAAHATPYDTLAAAATNNPFGHYASVPGSGPFAPSLPVPARAGTMPSASRWHHDCAAAAPGPQPLPLLPWDVDTSHGAVGTTITASDAAKIRALAASLRAEVESTDTVAAATATASPPRSPVSDRSSTPPSSPAVSSDHGSDPDWDIAAEDAAHAEARRKRKASAADTSTSARAVADTHVDKKNRHNSRTAADPHDKYSEKRKQNNQSVRACRTRQREESEKFERESKRAEATYTALVSAFQELPKAQRDGLSRDVKRALTLDVPNVAAVIEPKEEYIAGKGPLISRHIEMALDESGITGQRIKHVRQAMQAYSQYVQRLFLGTAGDLPINRYAGVTRLQLTPTELQKLEVALNTAARYQADNYKACVNRAKRKAALEMRALRYKQIQRHVEVLTKEARTVFPQRKFGSI